MSAAAHEAAPEAVANIALELQQGARRHPDRKAVVVAAGRNADGSARYEHITFGELEDRAGRYAAGLHRVGIGRGTRTVLMVKPGLDFFALVFALFRVGAVLVLIDPGIDRKALKDCLRETEPEAFVGIPLAHVMRLVFRSALKTVKTPVTVGRRWFWGGHRAEDLLDAEPRPVEPTGWDETAAILFTSGSTGIPKGAVYTHGIFVSQVRMLKAIYRFEDHEIDLSTFPLFALFMAGLGATAVIPDMDARKPAEADPKKLIEAITDHGCTTMFGSPALLDTLSTYGAGEGTKLPTIRRVLSAGAPVRHDILKRMGAMTGPGVQVFTPYGATESLPVCNVGSEEVLAETHALTASGAGVCVGRPVDGMTVRVIRISDDPIEAWSDELVVPTDTVGEIAVRGPVVTKEYFGRPDQTRLAKIREGEHTVHRMGDLGRFDAQGRLWMCGRKAHRVRAADGEHYTVPVEMVFNQHEGVRRSALVGVGEPGAEVPVLLVEKAADWRGGDEALVAALLELGRGFEVTRPVTRIAVFPGSFPVDIRHNAKIKRELLRHSEVARRAAS